MFYEKHKERYTVRKGDGRYFKVTASTHQSRKAVWGKHRTMKEKCLVQGTSHAQAKEIQKVYENEYGLTVFDNRIEKDPVKALYAITEWLPKGCKPTREEWEKKFWDTVT